MKKKYLALFAAVIVMAAAFIGTSRRNLDSSQKLASLLKLEEASAECDFFKAATVGTGYYTVLCNCEVVSTDAVGLVVC